MKTKKVLIKDGFWKKDLLWKLISLIFLLAFIVAGVKGNFFQKVLIRLNVIEKPMDRVYCVSVTVSLMERILISIFKTLKW